MILIRCFTAESYKKGERPTPIGWEPMWATDAHTEEEAEQWAQRIVDSYNDATGSNRIILYSETLSFDEALPLIKTGKVSPAPHTWRKTNLITKSDGTDRAECTVCGCRGIRRGLGDFRVDPKDLKKFPFGCSPCR